MFFQLDCRVTHEKDPEPLDGMFVPRSEYLEYKALVSHAVSKKDNSRQPRTLRTVALSSKPGGTGPRNVAFIKSVAV